MHLGRAIGIPRLKSQRFFVKSGIPSANQHQRDLFNREPRFFDRVVPRMLAVCNGEPWAPCCYLAKDGLLIFEDLSSRGFETVSEQFDETRLRSLFSCLARFHASSILLEESVGNKSINEIYPGDFRENMFYDDGKLTWKWLTTGIEAIEAVASQLNLDCKLGAEAYQLSLKTIKPVAGQLNVICHSDLWRNNVMFDLQGRRCLLVDFQLAAYKCHAVDLLQALHLNARRERRQQLEKGLIEHYHAQLSQCLGSHGYRGKAIGLEEVRQAVDRKRICGLVSAVQILPISLLSKQFASELCRDTQSLFDHMYVSWRSLILRAMQADPDYRDTIEEATTELSQYMANEST